MFEEESELAHEESLYRVFLGTLPVCFWLHCMIDDQLMLTCFHVCCLYVIVYRPS